MLPHMQKHIPGEKKILQKYHCKDATQAFNEINGHANYL